MTEEQQHKMDQIAYHFYSKLFSLVLDARLTRDYPSPKLDKWVCLLFCISAPLLTPSQLT
jgi:hypothetical protein